MAVLLLLGVPPLRPGRCRAVPPIVLTIRGTVSPSTPAGTLTNTASVSSSTPDPNPDNNTDRAVVDVAPSADLSVVKQGASSPAIPGQLFQYSIQIRNTGPSDSQEVLLSDAVPSVLLNPQFSTDNGQSWNPGAIRIPRALFLPARSRHCCCRAS